MAGTLITISDAFRAALVAAGNTGTNAHKVTKIGLCTAAFDASNKKLTKLPSELKRIDTFGGQNIAADTIHVTLLDSTAEQYTLWGFGFYLEDGTLAAYYSQKAADGPIMEKSPAAQLLLSVDVQFATIDAAALAFPSASFLNPPASESVQGVIRIATQAEVDAGTDNTRAITPKKAAARYAPLKAPKFSGPVTVTDIARVLIGTTADDGASALQVNGTGSFYGSVAQPAMRAASGVILGTNSGGDVVFRASGAGADQKIWDITSNNTEFSLRTVDDGWTSGKPWIRALRGSGNSVSTVWLAQGRVIVGNVADDGSNLLQVAGPAKFSSSVVASGSVTARSQVLVTGTSGIYRGMYIRNGESNRWSIGASSTAEANNAGADFSIDRYNDSGIWVDKPITVSRATGVTAIKNRALFGGAGDDGSTPLQVRGVSSGYGVTVRRDSSSSQYVGIGAAISAATDLTHNYIAAHSDPANAKSLVIGATTDTANTTPTAGSANVILRTLGITRATLTQAGRFLLGTTSDDGSNLLQVAGSAKFSSSIAASGSVTAGNQVFVTGASGNYRGVYIRNGASNRWSIGANATAEANNAGADFSIDRYNDSGTWVDTPITVFRATGVTAIKNRALFGGAVDDGLTTLQVNGAGSFYGSVAQPAMRAASGVILGTNGGGDVVFRASGAGADQKIWDITSNNTEFSLRTVDDGWTSGKPWIRALRGSGNSVSTVWLAQGRVIVGNVADDGSNLLQVAGPAKFSSSVVASGPVTARSQVLVTGTSGIYRGMYIRNGESNRWSIGASSTAEANNAGADFSIDRYNDSGTWVDKPITVSRATGVATFSKTPIAPTPATGDASGQLATTQFVATAILNERIGQIVYEPRNSVRAGYLKLNGALVKRADYPALWSYAQASGALVTEAAWTAGSWGCFSSGDGSTTFRIPELRGEHIRCWDDGRGVDAGRGIGTWQDSQNRSHAHGASAAAVGDHVHSAWTDAQGLHSHGGTTHAVGDHQHGLPNNGSAQAGSDNGGSPSPAATGSATARQPAPTGWAGGHAHGINADGSHGHNVGIGAAGGHTHSITVNAEGGTETRVRSVTLLAMIRAY